MAIVKSVTLEIQYYLLFLSSFCLFFRSKSIIWGEIEDISLKFRVQSEAYDVRFEKWKFRKTYTHHGKTTVNTKKSDFLEIHIPNFEWLSNWVNESLGDDKLMTD